MFSPRRPKKKPRRHYHQVDTEPLAFEEQENPDWLVGANRW